jgi:hypothetical protein
MHWPPPTAAQHVVTPLSRAKQTYPELQHVVAVLASVSCESRHTSPRPREQPLPQVPFGLHVTPVGQPQVPPQPFDMPHVFAQVGTQSPSSVNAASEALPQMSEAPRSGTPSGVHS